MVSPQQMVTGLDHLRLGMYLNCGGTALLIYDYFLTFPHEVSLIWDTRWNYLKILFLLTRYLPFVDAGLSIYHLTLKSTDAEICRRVLNAGTWLIYIGTALSEIVLTFRTWAVWNRDWRLSMGLPVFFCICWIPLIGVFTIFLNSLTFVSIDIPAVAGCLAIPSTRISFVAWILLLIYEAGIFLLMFIRGIGCYNYGGSSRLVEVVFRDGLLYYTVLFAFALANVILPPDLQAALVLFERFLHSIIACRVVLDIRGQVLCKTHPSWLDTPSFVNRPTPIAFVNPIEEDDDLQ